MVSEAEKRHIIEWFTPKYRRAKKKERGQIIDQAMVRGGWSRQHTARLLATGLKLGRPKIRSMRGRPSKYADPEFRKALKFIWRSTNYMCGRYLKEAMPDWLPSIERQEGQFPEAVRTKLLSVSASTIDRILKEFKGLHGMSLTRPTSFREEIPIQTNIWDIATPGYIEADTVAHCGGSMAGEFANTLTIVDINTLWTEPRMVFGRGSQNVFNALLDIERRLPFPILGYDADNGGEVLNNRILDYFIKERIEQQRVPVQVTRSREYRKNDNAHVEQRNNSVARRHFGYARYDFEALIPLMNYYYVAVVAPLCNHFIPSNKLKDKLRIKSRTRRVYEKPQTPYKRVMNSPHVSELDKALLQIQHEQLDPMTLSMEGKRIQAQLLKAFTMLKQGRDPGNLLIPPPTPKPAFQHHANYVTKTRISSRSYATKISESRKFQVHEL